MRELVVYTSKYGSTKQYAEWIAEELGCKAVPTSAVTAADVAASDVIICGGYLHMGKIKGAEFLVKNWDVLQPKTVLFFSVAGAPHHVPERTQWYEDNVPSHIRINVPHFPLPGRAMDLDLGDRMLVMVPRTMLQLRYWMKKDPADKAAIEGFKPFDGVDRNALRPLIAHVHTLAGPNPAY